MSTSTAPLEIGRVALTVTDIDTVADFYRTVLGLVPLTGDGATRTLGAGDRPLLELRADPRARVRSRREAGLFHTAFLLPDRAALGAWLRHAADSRVALEGASDHLVSEAIYLSDPEGNGIEVYADRPRDGWTTPAGEIRMASEPLDYAGVAASATAPWAGAPQGTVVGHVHLQVGATAEADAFYGGTLGLALTARYPGASFFGSGGYHHHIGANVWNSRGAGPREMPSTGLADLQFLVNAPDLAAISARAGSLPAADPWGTPLSFARKDG